jgi:hypothetical protein
MSRHQVHTRTDFFTSGQHVVILGGSLLLVLYMMILYTTVEAMHDGWFIRLSWRPSNTTIITKNRGERSTIHVLIERCDAQRI